VCRAHSPWICCWDSSRWLHMNRRTSWHLQTSRYSYVSCFSQAVCGLGCSHSYCVSAKTHDPGSRQSLLLGVEIFSMIDIPWVPFGACKIVGVFVCKQIFPNICVDAFAVMLALFAARVSLSDATSCYLLQFQLICNYLPLILAKMGSYRWQSIMSD
jgi:hypothetical protein